MQENSIQLVIWLIVTDAKAFDMRTYVNEWDHI